MKKIAILLSSISAKESKELNLLNNDYDEVIAVENITLPSELRENAVILEDLSTSDLANAHNVFAEIENALTPEELDFIAGHLDALSTGFLVTLFKVLSCCEKKLNEGAQLYIHSALSSSQIIPLFGYKTVEVNVGSDKLLGAVIAKVLASKFKNLINHVEQKKDVLCFPFVRWCALFSLELIALSKLLNKLTKLLKYRTGNSIDTARLTFLCRSRAHLEYALRLCRLTDQHDVTLYLFPQPRLGNVADLISTIESNVIDASTNVVIPSRLTLSSLFIKHTALLIKNFFSPIRRKFISIEGADFSADNLVLESRLFLTDMIYRDEIIRRLQNCKSDMLLVNFAVKGRFSALDNSIAKASSSKLITIQSINIVTETAFRFPPNDFLCDSRMSKVMKEGYTSNGTVSYEGCLFEFNKFNREVPRVKKIVFFTQPYELAVTKQILDFLMTYCQANNAELIIKLHPRDNASSYSFVSSNAKFSASASVEDALKEADLCITRTSAVYVESLALGIPVISVCLSEYDKTLQVQTLEALRTLGLCSYSLEQLEMKLDNLTSTILKSIEARKVLFGEKDINALAKFISEKAL